MNATCYGIYIRGDYYALVNGVDDIFIYSIYPDWQLKLISIFIKII